MAGGAVYEFGDFRLDEPGRLLSRGGHAIALAPKTFDVLRALVHKAGRLISKQDLLDLVWPETSVEEGILAVHISCLRKALGDDTGGRRYIETVARTGYRFVADVMHPAEQQRAVEQSIAVLPFANMNRDADDEYFCDGLAEEIINALSQISGVKVIARTSAFAFKGKNQDIRRIAEALGVTNLLEGSVRRTGDRLRVTAQLIHATDGTHRWSHRYDRDVVDVFAVQDEIATAIAAALRTKLTAQSADGRPHEPNLPAYEAFLKARHHWGRLFLKTPQEQGARIEEYLKEAIVLDPNWADPHSALGQLYFYWAAGPRSGEMIQLARAEARKALELLPSEPLAHAVLGAMAAVHDYDWQGSDEHFKLARASESLSPWVHNMYAACYLSPLGRFEEALQQAEKVIARDPLNTHYRASQLRMLLFAEMYDRAIVEARKEREFDERHISAHSLIALAYFFQGKLAEAREWAEEAFHRAPLNPLAAGLLAGLMKQSGENEQAEATRRGMRPLGMLVYHVVCLEIDAALDVYERAIEQRDAPAAMWASAGFLRPLRSNSRWHKLARMMNLPETG
jgi:TolB-like protein/Tfp pilus assembly protein PilF